MNAKRLTAAVVIIVIVLGVGIFIEVHGVKLSSTTQESSSIMTTGSRSSSNSSESVNVSRSSSSSPSSNSSSVSFSSSSSTTVATRMTSTSSTFDTSGYVLNMNDLLGNFSAASVEYFPVPSSSENFSYTYLGQYAVNSTQLRELNETVTTKSNSSSVDLWLNPAGNVTMITRDGQNITKDAQQLGQIYIAPFQTIFADSAQLQTLYYVLRLISVSSETLGSTQLTVTSYNGTYEGVNYTMDIGKVIGTQIFVIVYWSVTGSSSYTATFQVLALTRA